MSSNRSKTSPVSSVQEVVKEVDDSNLKDLPGPGVKLAQVRRRYSVPGALGLAGLIGDVTPLNQGFDFFQHMVLEIDDAQIVSPAMPELTQLRCRYSVPGANGVEVVGLRASAAPNAQSIDEEGVLPSILSTVVVVTGLLVLHLMAWGSVVWCCVVLKRMWRAGK